MTLVTSGTTRGVRLAVALTAALISAPLHAQLYDFTTSNGGYTNQNLVGSNPWSWTVGQGWSVGGVATAARSRLLGLDLTSNNANISVVIRHRFNFEGNATTCFDGGLIMQSIGGSAFEQITGGFTGTQYTNAISNSFGSPAGGASAFCNLSAGYAAGSFVTTTLSAAGVPLGTIVRLGLDGAWDSSVANTNPNWQIASIEFRGFGSSVVPEPSTYALMATGLVGLVGVARRRNRNS